MKLLSRIRQIVNKKESYNSSILFDEINKITKTSNTLAICGENTGPNWLGIKNATRSIYSNQTFVIPQHYSNQVISDKDFKLLVLHFKKLNGTTIIFSGIPNYFFKFIQIANECGLIVKLHFHGGLAELNQNKEGQNKIKNLIHLSKQGSIKEIIVVKEGLEHLFTHLTGIKTTRVTPALEIPGNLKTSVFQDKKIHIGVFGNNTYNKNRHTQVAAAAMVPNSIVHIIGENEFEYLLPQDRLITHNQLNRIEFLELLGSMNINLYCSYSESWGQVILESFALNTPCFFANNAGLSNVLGKEFDTFCVTAFDNPFEISKAVINYLKSPKEIPELKI